ncbi:hypothetical protein ACLB1R_27970 [Escherichia coli]
MKTLASERVAELKPAVTTMRACTIRQASVVHTLCTCCTMLTSQICIMACRRTRKSAKP